MIKNPQLKHFLVTGLENIKDMVAHAYLMESEKEIFRMELKTDRQILENQARWAGIRAGMRVADIGCGPGKTTSILYDLVQPGGTTVGIDFSKKRIAFANRHYKTDGISFECRNVLQSINDLGPFDFIWVRFLLEYHRLESFDIVKKLSKLVAPGGILCLIDLDHNCMNHFGAPDRLLAALQGVMHHLEDHHGFDPYAGRKLYAHLYDLNLADIDIMLSAHHLIFGGLSKTDQFNWIQKVSIAAKASGYPFDEFEGGYEDFYKAFIAFFTSPRRFTYTPVICCRGEKR